jgi:hypothetical protein
LLISFLLQLQVPHGGGCPPADAWLEVLPKVLNTQVVLLADNGLAASQKSLAVACQVYRWALLDSRSATFELCYDAAMVLLCCWLTMD